MNSNPLLVALGPAIGIIEHAAIALAVGAVFYIGILLYFKSKGYSSAKLQLIEFGMRVLSGFLALGILYAFSTSAEQERRSPEFRQKLQQAVQQSAHRSRPGTN